LLVFAEPMYMIESGPSLAWIAFILFAISSSASFHEIFTHLPPVFFMGDFSLNSEFKISAIEVPLEHIEPALIGFSSQGSIPVQTPFSIRPWNPQPTAQ
jgi:hypothetical protein